MSVCAKGGYRIQTHAALNLEIQSVLCVAGICSTREERGIFQTNSLDCNKRGDLTVLNLSQSTAKQNGKTPTTLPFIPDNPDGRISELLLDTTVVHPLPGPNSKHKLSLIEAKQNLRAADIKLAREKRRSMMSYVHRTVSSSYQSFLSPLAKCIHFFKIFSKSLWIP